MIRAYYLIGVRNMISEETRDFIDKAKIIYDPVLFENYIIQSGGVDKLKKEDLDQMILEVPNFTIQNPFIRAIYKMVSENESGHKMNRWNLLAISIALLSLVVSIITLYRDWSYTTP